MTDAQGVDVRLVIIETLSRAGADMAQVGIDQIVAEAVEALSRRATSTDQGGSTCREPWCIGHVPFPGDVVEPNELADAVEDLQFVNDEQALELRQLREAVVKLEFKTQHPGLCPDCGWHWSSHAKSAYGLCCPQGTSPVNAAGQLPSQQLRKSATEGAER